MEQQQEEEATPLQSVKDCCRRLRQEWEGMMQNADIASTEVLSSLKAQEAALMVERAHVQALKQETDNLRRSFLQQTEEQEKKVLAERSLADEIRKNIHNQLGEVKQMQCQLSSQLARIRSSMENLKKPKQEEHSANSIVVTAATSELCSSVPHQPVQLMDLEKAGNITSRPKDANEHAPTPRQIFEQSYVKVKAEPLSDNECAQSNEHLESRVKSSGSLQISCDNGPLVHKRCQVSHVSVKTELEEEAGCALKKLPSNEKATAGSVALEDHMDKLDKVLLSQRLEILVQRIRNGQFTKEDYLGIPTESEMKKQFCGPERNLKAKRKRDVPIEIALQEDAPGLLEKLEEKGLVDDMVVYGAFCEDEWGNGDDHFKDLECIASKLWGTPTGLLKQPQAIRQHASGFNKASTYCLSCLVSLIDQAKSLRQRNWPVEWGWCRELQAFIFVFDKHNRIVLERPEYGNATYFFELVQFLPVKWQVLRMIRVLSVTALGKTALLENRPLEVGYELTADESKVLEYYGWAPSTGLGSFLNFCDRVYHDVKEDDNNIEWRQKIGKCLMDGYDKGRIITPVLPPMFLEAHGNAKFDEDTNQCYAVDIKDEFR
eukprot:c23750_g1_i3 orf=79-1887(+)